MGGRILYEHDMSPELWAGLQERSDFLQRAIAARPALDHATAYLAALGPEVCRRLTPDPRLEATLAPEPARSVVQEAADLLAQISDGLNPSDRETADAALAVAILARAQTLIDAAKARLET